MSHLPAASNPGSIGYYELGGRCGTRPAGRLVDARPSVRCSGTIRHRMRPSWGFCWGTIRDGASETEMRWDTAETYGQFSGTMRDRTRSDGTVVALFPS